MLGAPSRGTPTKPPPVKKWPGEGGGNLNRNIPQQTPQVLCANEATPGPPLCGPPRGGCGLAFGVPGHKIAGLRVAVQQKWVSRQEAAPRSRRINIRAGGAGGGCRDSKGHRAKRSTVSQVGYPSEVAESFVGHSGRGSFPYRSLIVDLGLSIHSIHSVGLSPPRSSSRSLIFSIPAAAPMAPQSPPSRLRGRV